MSTAKDMSITNTPETAAESAEERTARARNHAATLLANDIALFVSSIVQLDTVDEEELAKVRDILLEGNFCREIELTLAEYAGESHAGSWNQMILAERLLERLLAFTEQQRYCVLSEQNEDGQKQYTVYDRVNLGAYVMADGKPAVFTSWDEARKVADTLADTGYYVVTEQDKDFLEVHAGPMTSAEAMQFAKDCGEGFKSVDPVWNMPKKRLMPRHF